MESIQALFLSFRKPPTPKPHRGSIHDVLSSYSYFQIDRPKSTGPQDFCLPVASVQTIYTTYSSDGFGRPGDRLSASLTI